MNPPPPDIQPKVLKAARTQANLIAAKAKNLFTFSKAKTWSELAYTLGITIPSVFTTKPYDWPNVNAFATYWTNSVVERLTAPQIRITSSATPPKFSVDSVVCEHFASASLLPEQQYVFDKWRRVFFTDKIRHTSLQDGEMGSGKTFVAAALIADCIKKQLHRDSLPIDIPYRYLVVTRKTIIESYKRVLERFGLGEHIRSGLIYVTSYSAMTSTAGKIFYNETDEYDPYDESQSTHKIIINAAIAPFLIVWDEAHATNNHETQQTQLAIAYGELPNPPYQIFMSATPWTKVNDSRTFVLASRFKFNGMLVTKDTFPQFAGSICREPHKPNIAAAKRLREVLEDYIDSFPYVKWPHKAINQALLVDFETSNHRDLYDTAYEIYQERKRRSGQNTEYGSFDAFVALNVFRHAVEPFRVPAMVDRSLAAIKSGKAIIMMAAYKETVAQAAFRFKQAGYTRDQISIIWGGKRKWKKELLLSDAQLEEMVQRVVKGGELTSEEMRSLQETNLYNTERIMYGMNEAEHEARVKAMEEFGLTGNQSSMSRQAEIDKFQSGQSLICLATLSAGGVGLSLDQCEDYLRPRESYLTPTFNGPEVKQAMGRGMRRTTKSDIYQYMCYMIGTVEEGVAALMDTKFKCIDAITKNSFNIIDLDTCPKVEHKYRSAEEAAADADSDEAQIQDYNTEIEDED